MAEEQVKQPNSMMVIKFDNQKIPEFKQVRGKEWIYWGVKNDYPDYLIELFMRSSTHNAIVTGKVNYILGNGIKANKKGLTINEQALLNDFIRHINKDETLDELLEKTALDFEIFNALAFEVIWNKANTKFELFHVPINKLRTNEDQSKYFYSKDWSLNVTQDKEKTGFKELVPFDFEQKKNGLFIYQITAPRKGKDPNVYSIPEYIGSTQAIETEAEISNYNLTEIKTGFSAGTMINFYNGIPTEEKKEEIEKMIKAKMTGTDKAGQLVINFADGKERGSDVTSLTGNDLDKRYIEVRKDVTKTIFTGHKVSDPKLFGASSEGVVFERQASILSQEQFQSQYVDRRQRILTKILNKFAGLAGLRGNLEILPVSVSYGIPESVIAQALPIDFVKEKLGVPVKEEQSSQTKLVLDALNSLSPLVANKVLESMSVEEIRALVNLSGGVVKTTTKTETQKMKSQEFENILFEKLSAIGRPKSKYDIFKSREIFHADTFKIAQAELEVFKKNDLSALDLSIIDLLNKDNKMPVAELAKALKTDSSTISASIKKLISNDYLSLSPEKQIGDIVELIPTTEGIDAIDSNDVKTMNVEVLYSYELRKNAPKLLPGGTSREFCKKLVEIDFLYTRAEIDNLSNEFGTDVWTYKGGWYTNPNTDAPTPQCRHLWVQNVVKRK